jgi:peptidyl-prolyl cis-trans isomerase D
MATLEKIRNRGVLLIVIIGLALAAFILGDLFQSGTSLSGDSSREIAEIAGESVMIDYYQRGIEELSEVYKMNTGSQTLDAQTTDQIQDQVWNNLLREVILGKEYKKLGLAVTGDELFEMVQGNNIHPIVSQLFANPETGQVDRSVVLNFLKQLDRDEKTKNYWLYIENEIKNQRWLEKYNTLIQKGLYTNSKEAEFVFEGNKMTKAIEFFAVPYNTIADSAIVLSSSEIKKRYEETKENYKQEASRQTEYITFDILASSDDDVAVKEWATKAIPEYSDLNEFEEVIRFVNLNSDERWDGRYVSVENVDAGLKDFVASAEKGAVFGPYKEADAYVLAKVVDLAARPDSMKASHILIREPSQVRTDAVADSLMDVLKKDKSKFAALAQSHSLDQGSAANGGSLGWFADGVMVKPFNDACIDAKEGEIVKVASQFGVHVILVESKSKPTSKVQLAKVVRKVTPSTDTYRKIYSDASKFVGQNNTSDKFMEGVKTDGLSKKYGRNISINDKMVNNMEGSREMVRWAYKAKVGEISPIFEFDKQFVIAVLTEVKEEGYTPLSEVSAQIRAELVRRKKGDQIARDIEAKKATSQSLSSLAQTMNMPLKSADNINFSAYFVTGVGYEPALIGAVVASKPEVISNPVIGSTGVFVFRVMSEVASVGTSTIEEERAQLEQSYSYRANYQPFSALQKKAEIKDNRYRFY